MRNNALIDTETDHGHFANVQQLYMGELHMWVIVEIYQYTWEQYLLF